MNQPISESAVHGVIEIVARPHRSASIPLLALIFSALSIAVIAVASFSFWQGNVFAPVFAVLDLLLVGSCLWWVWRRGDDFDRVSIDRTALTVERYRRGRTWQARYATPWARLWAQPQAQRVALLVGSHGKATEIGDFLADDERERLERLMRQRLSDMRAELRT